MEEDGAKYIGPYMSSWSTKQTVDSALKIFKLPDCSRKFPQDFGKGRPCLNYYIKQCCAPCRGKVTEAEYNEAFQEAMDFIKGGSSSSVKVLHREDGAGCGEPGVRAGRPAAGPDQRHPGHDGAARKWWPCRVEEQDVFALAQGETHTAFEVFRFTEQQPLRPGELSDRGLPAGPARPARSSCGSITPSGTGCRPWWLLDGEVEDAELLARWLTRKAGQGRAGPRPPEGGPGQLVEMCRNNAAEQHCPAGGHLRAGRLAPWMSCAGCWDWTQPPAYIESYDISNLAGGDNVAGMVVFENGRPLKSAYRQFQDQNRGGAGRLRLHAGGAAAGGSTEYEAQPRRSGKGFGRLPDLILLDGGKGHVAAVQPRGGQLWAWISRCSAW